MLVVAAAAKTISRPSVGVGVMFTIGADNDCSESLAGYA